VFFHFGEQAIFKYGASNEAHQDLRANDLVMWEALKYYASHGFRLLHLGRTSLANAGLRRFKLAWGAREHIIEYVRYDLKLRAFVTGKDDAFGWYNRGFRLLPIGVSRLIGTLLYRHAA
jgi:lipid II:glycine glycyltransferase (peptidoglycan interpeptide bridge formation enzyme)